MIYSQILVVNGVHNMWFFGKPKVVDVKKEAVAQASHKKTIKKINEAKKTSDKLNKLLDDIELGVTGKIFYATGGDKRTNDE